jgi:hypothetical protein
VKLHANESVFVVLTKTPRAAVQHSAEIKTTTVLTLNGSEWNIHFPRINQEIKDGKLFDWTTSLNEKVKYYSGTTTYHYSTIPNNLCLYPKTRQLPNISR